jgi:hypothetical protein
VSLTFRLKALFGSHLGEQGAADQLMHAIERAGEAGIMTPDVGGKATTREVTEAVSNAIRERNILTDFALLFVDCRLRASCPFRGKGQCTTSICA